MYKNRRWSKLFLLYIIIEISIEDYKVEKNLKFLEWCYVSVFVFLKNEELDKENG